MAVKVLIADDNKLILAMAKDALEGAGHAVRTAESGAEPSKPLACAQGVPGHGSRRLSKPSADRA